jgi:S-layer homology domain
MRSSVLLMGLVTGCILPLAACSNTPWAANLQRSLAADPRLAQNPVIIGSSPLSSPLPSASPSPANLTSSQLPASFPGEIPRYPNAKLIEAISPTQTNEPTETRWSTADSAAQVQQFYQDKFKADGWQTTQPTIAATESKIAAQRDSLRVAIETSPASGATEFKIRYLFQTGGAQTGAIAPAPTASATATPTTAAQTTTAQTTAAAQTNPSDPNFIGPVPPSDWAAKPDAPPPTSVMASLAFTDLNQAPAELQQYVTDLANLGALPLRSANPTDAANKSSSQSSQPFKPNQAIARREYARWLVTANNLIYTSQPSRQIRLGTAAEKPAFVDVPASDPDFGTIQGLANAGLISSSLSGEPAAAFRPDAPLTREEMILWKVPVDIRRSLPTTNLDAVQQTWGFQDAPKIEPKALRAVLADYQNGDLANIRRSFGYTTLFQPQKTVTRAEAAAALWYFGAQGDGLSAKDALQISRQPETTGG